MGLATAGKAYVFGVLLTFRSFVGNFVGNFVERLADVR